MLVNTAKPSFPRCPGPVSPERQNRFNPGLHQGTTETTAQTRSTVTRTHSLTTPCQTLVLSRIPGDATPCLLGVCARMSLLVSRAGALTAARHRAGVEATPARCLHTPKTSAVQEASQRGPGELWPFKQCKNPSLHSLSNGWISPEVGSEFKTPCCSLRCLSSEDAQKGALGAESQEGTHCLLNS